MSAGLTRSSASILGALLETGLLVLICHPPSGLSGLPGHTFLVEMKKSFKRTSRNIQGLDSKLTLALLPHSIGQSL